MATGLVSAEPFLGGQDECRAVIASKCRIFDVQADCRHYD
jgi:hypothetical protein